MFSSSVLRVPVGVGLETRLTVAGSMARARLASLASVLIPLSSALESPGIRMNEPKIKAILKEKIATKRFLAVEFRIGCLFNLDLVESLVL